MYGWDRRRECVSACLGAWVQNEGGGSRRPRSKRRSDFDVELSRFR